MCFHYNLSVNGAETVSVTSLRSTLWCLP